MKVSLVNVNLVAQDAIGQCMLNQVRFFQRRGDEVHVYVMYPPQGVSDDVAKLTHVVSLADLAARHDAHFVRSDLYVFHYPGRYPLIETIKGIDRGAVIFYYHNVTPPELWASAQERDLLRRSQAGVGELLPYSDLVVTPSPFNAEQLVEEHAGDRDRIRVLPLAVPLEHFNPGPRDMALVRQYNLEGRRVILFVGRMAGNKRIDLLVEALSLIQRRVPNATLMLVGDNSSNPAFVDYVAQVKTRAEALGVADSVIFTGRVDNLPSYYRLADVYATASLHEGFGVPLIEAMASGVPVVASRATAHPWVVGDAGLLVEPGDSSDLAVQITRVLTDDSLHGELVQRGLARARDFSLEQYETGWFRIVVEATAWLPDSPYPRLRSIPAQPAPRDAQTGTPLSAQTIHEVLVNGELEQLEAQADVKLYGYVVHSKLPIIGPLVAWLRKNLTSHLREPYLDPMFERQVAFNQRVVQQLRTFNEAISARISAVDRRIAVLQQLCTALETRIQFLEVQQTLLSTQLAMPEWATAHSSDVTQVRQQLAELQRMLDEARAELGAGQNAPYNIK